MKHQVHPAQINCWKQQALAAIQSGFNRKHEAIMQSNQKLTDDLYHQIGQLICENDFF